MLLVARAVVKSPTLQLLDELCEGLDFANCRNVLEIIEFFGRNTESTNSTFSAEKSTRYINPRPHVKKPGMRASSSSIATLASSLYLNCPKTVIWDFHFAQQVRWFLGCF